MSLFKNVNVISYFVTDWERGKEFYARVLGWPEAYVDDQMGWAEWGKENETHIAIRRLGENETLNIGNSADAVLSVEDADAALKALRGMGVRCDDVVRIPGMVNYGVFYDPDGNSIQFASFNV